MLNCFFMEFDNRPIRGEGCLVYKKSSSPKSIVSFSSLFLSSSSPHTQCIWWRFLSHPLLIDYFIDWEWPLLYTSPSSSSPLSRISVAGDCVYVWRLMNCVFDCLALSCEFQNFNAYVRENLWSYKLTHWMLCYRRVQGRLKSLNLLILIRYCTL